MEQQITLSTEVLQQAVAKAIRGSSRKNILFITTLIGIRVKSGNLVLTTTSSDCTLEVTVAKVANSNVDFYTCTDSDLFAKLISKINSTNVDIIADGDKIVIKSGKNTYTLPQMIEAESTECVHIPVPVFDDGEVHIMKGKDLKRVNKYNEACAAKTFETPCLTNYCIGDKYAVTFNNITACFTDVKGIGKGYLLFDRKVVDLFDLLKDDDVSITLAGNKVAVNDGSVYITGVIHPEVDEFPVSSLEELINATYASTISFNKAEVLSALDRLSLFADVDGFATVRLSVEGSVALLSNYNGDTFEKFTVAEGSTSYSQLFSLDMLKSVISSISQESFELSYGSDICILIKEPGVMRLIATVQEDVEEEA